MKLGLARVALSHGICTGISRCQLAELIQELADPWQARHESGLRVRRGGRGRLRAAGAGPRHDLVFVDRVIATLVIVRFQLPHAVLALWYGVHRCTITRSVHEIRPLLAARGCATPEDRGVRLRTLADVFAYAAAHGVALRADGTEIQVRRPHAHRPGRRAFLSGKKKQNTKKATVISDATGRLLWVGAIRPGRMHDQTALRTEGIDGLFDHYPDVACLMDNGYRGLAKNHPDQISVPPLKPKHNATPEHIEYWEKARKTQSSQRICVEHTIGEIKVWRPLQRWIGNRTYLDETLLAIAGLVSDRTATR